MKEKVVCNKDAKKAISAIRDIHPVAAEILYNRGYKTKDEMKTFFEDVPLHDPSLLKDGIKGAEILRDAILRKEKIVIYTDTDADGICSAGILVPILQLLEADVVYYTNNKQRDGFGACIQGVKNILTKWPDTKVIMTSDNGIVAHEAIQFAKETGIRFIVTDHHEPGDVLPPADAIINPKQPDCKYPFKNICGAAVAWKVMDILLQAMHGEITPDLEGITYEALQNAIEIVALATIADVMPLVDENRTIVKMGLEIMNKRPSVPIAAFKKMLGIAKMDAIGSVAFKIAPHLNSPSRMCGDPSVAIELMLTRDATKAEAFVANMMTQNTERKTLTEKNFKLAKALVEDPLPLVIVVQNQAIDSGIAGIVAGQLKETYGRPAIVLGEDYEEFCVGSARSVDGFNIKEALDEMSDILYKHGGHAKAAGLTFDSKYLEEFKRRINEIAAKVLDEESLRPTIHIDAVATNEELGIAAAEAVEALGPFGEGWPEPIIGLTFSYTDAYYMGQTKEHVKLVDRTSGLSIIGWNLTSKFSQSEVDFNKAIGTLCVNDYNGRRSAQFFIKDDMLYEDKS